MLTQASGRYPYQMNQSYLQHLLHLSDVIVTINLPFGITSAPEHFQQRMNSLLLGLQGVLCVMDDIIVFGKNQQERNGRLHAVLTRLSASGMTLNSEKCEFSKSHLTFLGHVIDSQGISLDPSNNTHGSAKISYRASPIPRHD